MTHPKRHARGIAYLVVLIVLAVCGSMAVALAVTSGSNARKSKNLADVHRARYAAESGFSFAIHSLRSVTVPATTTVETALPRIAAALGERLNGTGNLGGAAITCDADTVTVPRIDLGGGAFEVRVVRSGETLLLLSTGRAGEVARTVCVDLLLGAREGTTAFDYGVASMGAIAIDGDAQVHGRNTLNDASVISLSSDAVAISVGGCAVVDGDLSSCGESTSIVINGTPTIAGSQDPEVIAQHIHFGVPEPVFPDVDTTVFRDLTTTTIDSDTDITGHGLVFENVRIKAGTNPTFTGDVVLNGVVYVEAPNIVTFSSKVTVNGVLATEPTTEPIQSCKISFGGEVEAFGAEVLPDLPQYTEVKQLTGTFVAAPGFQVSFAGEFHTINGTIAADQLSFSGEASGSVQGSVIGLSDEPLKISGFVNVMIDRGGDGSPPAGFSIPLLLDVTPRSYRELIGGDS